MKILIAVDDSICSAAVVEDVEKKAWQPESEFLILSVIEALADRSNGLDDSKDEKSEYRMRLLTEFADRVRHVHNVLTVSPDLRQGDPEDTILAVAKEWGADLIMIGSQGRRGFARLLLGSVAMHVLLRARCTVEVIKGRYSPREGLNVLVPYDGSIYSDKAVQAMIERSWHPTAQVKLLAVVPPLLEELFGLERLTSFEPADCVQEENEAMEQNVMMKISRSLKQLHGKFGRLKTHVEVTRGDARDVILRQAEAWPAHLIVLGSHGRTGIERFFLGSVSHAVSLYANCSVAIVR